MSPRKELGYKPLCWPAMQNAMAVPGKETPDNWPMDVVHIYESAHE